MFIDFDAEGNAIGVEILGATYWKAEPEPTEKGTDAMSLALAIRRIACVLIVAMLLVGMWRAGGQDFVIGFRSAFVGAATVPWRPFGFDMETEYTPHTGGAVVGILLGGTCGTIALIAQPTILAATLTTLWNATNSRNRRNDA